MFKTQRRMGISSIYTNFCSRRLKFPAANVQKVQICRTVNKKLVVKSEKVHLLMSIPLHWVDSMVTISKTKLLSFYKSLVAMPNSENNQICTSYIYTFLRQAFPWQESRCHWPELCASLCKFEAKLFAVI